MPALGHLLSVEQGKVLSLAADEKHVYAGCQSADNEITVGIRCQRARLSVTDVYLRSFPAQLSSRCIVYSVTKGVYSRSSLSRKEDGS